MRPGGAAARQIERTAHGYCAGVGVTAPALTPSAPSRHLRNWTQHPPPLP
uniref:Uncharacterized protein n=1 Tax=Arundo donax TaxID=35708 RepID=A0A0A9FLS8_ARUDO